MIRAVKPHPDRLATTLAQRAMLPESAWRGPFQEPGPGSADARVDLALLWHRAREAVARRGTPQARARLAEVESPDLMAGTVQDGTARGVAVALEEAISLCRPEPAPQTEPAGPADVLEETEFTGKDLRAKHDLLVKSEGARIRFSRKGGLLFLDRDENVRFEDFVWFEDRSDRGTLDAFEPDPLERPRIFKPSFLVPVRFVRGRRRHLLELEGMLGRRGGYPCRMRIEGRADESFVRLTIAIHNVRDDHRLRVRFMGLRDPGWIGHRGTPAFEVVEHDRGCFVAATLVRACGRLRVGDDIVAVPAAQCRGWIEHEFQLPARAAAR